MSGFTDKGLSVTKEPFTGWAADLAKITSGLQGRISGSIDQVMAGMEQGLQDEIRSHPAWPNDMASKASIRAHDGEYQVRVDDPRAHGLEFGNDPEHAPAALVDPFGAKSEQAMGEQIQAAVRREIGL